MCGHFLTLNLGFINVAANALEILFFFGCTPFFAKRVLRAYVDGDEHISSKK